MAKSRPKLDYSLGSEGNRTLEYYAAPLLEGPGIVRCGVSHSPSAFWLCATPCPGRVLAQTCRQIATPVTACNFQSAEFQLYRLVAECITTKACTSLIKGSLSTSPRSGHICLHHEGAYIFSLAVRALSVRFSPRHTHHPYARRGKLTI